MSNSELKLLVEKEDRKLQAEKRRERYYIRAEKGQLRNLRRQTLSEGVNIFGIILLLLIAICLLSSLSGSGNVINTMSLLEFLQSLPSVDVNWAFTLIPPVDFADWAIGFELIINALIGMISIIAFVATALVNCIGFLFGFLGFIFTV